MAGLLSIAAFLLLCTAGSCAFRLWYVRRKRRKMEEQVAEARKTLEQMEGLLLTPGWKAISEIARVQVEGRKNEVLLKPTKDGAEENYMKGEIQGIELMASFPKKLIEMSKDILEAARKLENEGA